MNNTNTYSTSFAPTNLVLAFVEHVLAIITEDPNNDDTMTAAEMARQAARDVQVTGDIRHIQQMHYWTDRCAGLFFGWCTQEYKNFCGILDNGSNF